MDILVINCGSSSLKYQLINTDTEEVLASGICDRIGIDGGQFSYKPKDGEKSTQNIEIKDHEVAIKLVLGALTNPFNGAVKSLETIKAIGHRIVHG